MKKSILLIFLLMAATAAFTQNEMSFVVEGYSPYYNQVRIVNETSFSNFHCRLVYLNEDNTTKEVFGHFELKGRGDVDTNTENRNVISKGSLMAIQFPKDFNKEVSFLVEYKDFPMLHAIIIHLTSPDSEYE